jgi:hypothetical protein
VVDRTETTRIAQRIIANAQHKNGEGLTLSMPPFAGLPMEVLFLTTLFSVVFAIFFLLLFFSSRQNRHSCSDQDALIPFRDDLPAVRATAKAGQPDLSPSILPINPTSTPTEDDQR